MVLRFLAEIPGLCPFGERSNSEEARCYSLFPLFFSSEAQARGQRLEHFLASWIEVIHIGQHYQNSHALSMRQ